MDLKKILAGTSVAIFLTIAFTSDSQHFSTFAQTARPAETKGIAVAPQYDTTHVYVSPQDFAKPFCPRLSTFSESAEPPISAHYFAAALCWSPSHLQRTWSQS
jgi:hypothetical protein